MGESGPHTSRELQELSQNQLGELTGIPQTTISAIENERVRLGVERAKVLARALKCRPAVLVFPQDGTWNSNQQPKVAMNVYLVRWISRIRRWTRGSVYA